MKKDFEKIFQEACDLWEGVAPYEGALSHLLAKHFDDEGEGLVAAFLFGALYQKAMDEQEVRA
jgi:hypothetical protein